MESNSYRKISDAIQLEPSSILFVTDVVKGRVVLHTISICLSLLMALFASFLCSSVLFRFRSSVLSVFSPSIAYFSQRYEIMYVCLSLLSKSNLFLSRFQSTTSTPPPYIIKVSPSHSLAQTVFYNPDVWLVSTKEAFEYDPIVKPTPPKR